MIISFLYGGENNCHFIWRNSLIIRYPCKHSLPIASYFIRQNMFIKLLFYCYIYDFKNGILKAMFDCIENVILIFMLNNYHILTKL